MRLALLGYGRMGRAVEEEARERGHEVALRLTSEDNPGGRGITAQTTDGVDVAVDFSVPGAVVENVRACVAQGLDMVVGTTGWHDRMDEVRALVESGRAGLIHGANFSLGVQLLFRLARRAGRLAEAVGGYDVHVSEVHHRHKVDHPSGTALVLARALLEELSGKATWAPAPGEGPVDPAVLQVTSVRVGEEPGTHVVALDGPHDRIELRHQARGRRGFAAGAVRAAEWIPGRKGVFSVDDMLGLPKEEATDD